MMPTHLYETDLGADPMSHDVSPVETASHPFDRPEPPAAVAPADLPGPGLLQALFGKDGELDAWLAVNDEQAVKGQVMDALAEKEEEAAGRLRQWQEAVCGALPAESRPWRHRDPDDWPEFAAVAIRDLQRRLARSEETVEALRHELSAAGQPQEIKAYLVTGSSKWLDSCAMQLEEAQRRLDTRGDDGSFVLPLVPAAGHASPSGAGQA